MKPSPEIKRICITKMFHRVSTVCLFLKGHVTRRFELICVEQNYFNLNEDTKCLFSNIENVACEQALSISAAGRAFLLAQEECRRVDERYARTTC